MVTGYGFRLTGHTLLRFGREGLIKVSKSYGNGRYKFHVGWSKLVIDMKMLASGNDIFSGV